MNVVVYGTTGIVGYGVLHECLKATVGMQEDEYERITYSLTLASAEALIARNPQMTFIYVSGAGADSSTKRRKCGRG